MRCGCELRVILENHSGAESASSPATTMMFLVYTTVAVVLTEKSNTQMFPRKL